MENFVLVEGAARMKIEKLGELFGREIESGDDLAELLDQALLDTGCTVCRNRGALYCEECSLFRSEDVNDHAARTLDENAAFLDRCKKRKIDAEVVRRAASGSQRTRAAGTSAPGGAAPPVSNVTTNAAQASATNAATAGTPTDAPSESNGSTRTAPNDTDARVPRRASEPRARSLEHESRSGAPTDRAPTRSPTAAGPRNGETKRDESSGGCDPRERLPAAARTAPEAVPTAAPPRADNRALDGPNASTEPTTAHTPPIVPETPDALIARHLDFMAAHMPLPPGRAVSAARSEPPAYPSASPRTGQPRVPNLVAEQHLRSPSGPALDELVADPVAEHPSRAPTTATRERPSHDPEPAPAAQLPNGLPVDSAGRHPVAEVADADNAFAADSARRINRRAR